jgi:hypothetical protein
VKEEYRRRLTDNPWRRADQPQGSASRRHQRKGNAVSHLFTANQSNRTFFIVSHDYA